MASPSTAWDYTAVELVEGLRTVGLGTGDTVLVHAGLERLGLAKECRTPPEGSALLLGALREVIGPNGTLLVPTYTFSFCRGELFDVQQTPTAGGPWSPSAAFLECVRRHPQACRSHDPIHSVGGLGPRAAELLTDVAPTCFGSGSIFDRLRRARGKVCLVGLDLGEASFQHHVEEMVGVPHRFRKLFTGHIRDAGSTRKAGWVYNVRILAENGAPDSARLECIAREEGTCRAASVGRGEVLAFDCEEYFQLLSRELARDPWYTAKGPRGNPIALEDCRVGSSRPAVTLPANASMAELINGLWRLPRHLISDAYDAALQALATQVPMTIHEYPSGTDCWTWIVPEKWTCHEAYLETLDGHRLFSTADHPLHVVSYSLPFEGTVSRETLLQHLHVHYRLPDAVPFIFKYYERDWGLCCTKEQRDRLTDEQYRVVIRTSFSQGTLKVGEVVVRGQSSETIVLCAHLCHPTQVNDDLTGVVVGLEVMRELLRREDLRFTYRLLILPETIGSLAYLSHHAELIPEMRGGLFLEMLGRPYPHSLQLSYSGASEVDRCFTLALRRHDPHGWTGPFGAIIGNDERQFNAPGIRVPMLSLSRVLEASHPDWPYPGYHSSQDTPEAISLERLADSRALVLRMIDTLENNRVPLNRFSGEVFCSRYGITIDWWKETQATRTLFEIMYQVDGTRSMAEIAEGCGASFEAVKATIDELLRHGLVTLK